MKHALKTLIVGMAGLAMAQPAMAKEMALDQALKLADIHIKCAAYYKGGPGNLERSDIYANAARDLVEVYTRSSKAEAWTRVERGVNRIIEGIEVELGGNFEDPKIPAQFKTVCPKYDPQRHAKYRISETLLAAHRGENEKPVQLAAVPTEKPEKIDFPVMPSVVPPVMPSGPGIPLTIKTVAGKSIPVRIEQTRSVADLKAEIERIEGIAPGRQVLVYADKPLKDSWLLLNYNIRKDSTLSLITSSAE